MIDFLKSWIINIVIVIFFIAFIEILLPTSNMKKYINMVFGLLIIIVLINPIIKLMSSDINIDREVFYNLRSYNTFGVEGNSKYIELQNQQITEVYKKKLAKEIAEVIKTQVNYKVLEIKVHIEEDIAQDDFGKLTGVEVYLGTDINNQEGKYIKIDDIDNITINTHTSSETIDDKKNLAVIKEIINSISSFYKVPGEKVLVTIRE